MSQLRVTEINAIANKVCKRLKEEFEQDKEKFRSSTQYEELVKKVKNSAQYRLAIDIVNARDSVDHLGDLYIKRYKGGRKLSYIEDPDKILDDKVRKAYQKFAPLATTLGDIREEVILEFIGSEGSVKTTIESLVKKLSR